MPSQNKSSFSGNPRITDGPSLKTMALIGLFSLAGSSLLGCEQRDGTTTEFYNTAKKFYTNMVDKVTERLTHPKEEPLTPCL
jgi:hypothetical protein